MTTSPPDFVPLAASAAVHGKLEQFRVLIADTPEKARPWHEMNHDSANHNPPGSQFLTCEPRVTLERTGDHITSIQIRCSCGQLINLICDYAGMKG